MQTFLPFPDFQKSAQSLDSQRLGKQRSEVKQLLISIYFETLKGNLWLAEAIGMTTNLLVNPTYGWSRHPARMMWENYPFALITYGMDICTEWRNRGNKDTVLEQLGELAALNPALICDQNWLRVEGLMPSWLGDERLHQSHRSNLLRKDPVWYGTVQGWKDPNDIPYWWPDVTGMTQ